jgi:hypothetical protein
MARNGKDPFRQLLADVAELKSTTRSLSESMTSVSETMASVSATMALTAKTMGAMSKRMSGQENLYARLARTLVAFKENTDERFEEVEERLLALEAMRH